MCRIQALCYRIQCETRRGLRGCGISIQRARRGSSATRYAGSAARWGPDVPVIGFAAAPWTLACYMIEGQTRGDISRAKKMLREEPQVVRALLERITRATAGYLAAQIEAGATAVQLFDTWAGGLAAEEYEEFELPATQKIIESPERLDSRATKCRRYCSPRDRLYIWKAWSSQERTC